MFKEKLFNMNAFPAYYTIHLRDFRRLWKSLIFKNLNLRLGQTLNPPHSKFSEHATPSTKSCTGGWHSEWEKMGAIHQNPATIKPLARITQEVPRKISTHHSPRNRNKTPHLKKKWAIPGLPSPQLERREQTPMSCLWRSPSLLWLFLSGACPAVVSLSCIRQGSQEKCFDLSLDTSGVGMLPFRILTMSLAQNFVLDKQAS